MSTAALVELICLVAAGVAVGYCFVLKAELTDERIATILARAAADDYRQRALDLQAEADETLDRLARLQLVHSDCPATAQFELDTDQARLIAHPTPDLRRVR